MDEPDVIDHYLNELGRLVNKMRAELREEVIHAIFAQIAYESEMRIIAKAELEQSK